MNQLYLALGNHESAFGVFYDFTKAFDMVNHQLLISKLSSFGIRGIASTWISSYLTMRTHITKITNKGESYYSEEANVSIGLPQGSIISPLLFILFTDDMPSIIQQGQLTLFADDTTYFLKNKDNSDEITNSAAVNKISAWVAENNLCLNEAKTVLLQFHHKKDLYLKSSPLVYLNGKSLIPQNSTKFLGLTIDINLNWNEHIDAVNKKMASGCYLINRIRKICNLETAKLVYHAYVHSRISYGILLWGHSSKTRKLFTLQKRAIKYLAQASFNPCTPGMYFKDSCRPYFSKFNILTLTCLYIYTAIVFIIDNKHLTSMVNEVHDHQTRNKNNLKQDKRFSKFNRMDPIVIGTSFFNKASTIFNCNSINPKPSHNFKSKLKQFLITNAFYSIDEFMSYKNV
jgi:Reverse transcriptase (RNA-dependent DNA polymerase)